MIEEKKLYPITFIKGLNADTRNKLTSNGIITLKQLTQQTSTALRRQTGISKDKFEVILDNAKAILAEN